jgi:epoxyqueuosine reductase
MLQDPRAPTRELLEQVLASAGFDLVAVADAALSLPQEAEYRRWIALGCHGTMDYLRRHAALKYRPQALLQDCRSVIVVGLGYYQTLPADAAPRTDGRVAMYAWGRDYHKVLGRRLRTAAQELQRRFPSAGFRGFTDATPLAERRYAAAAGVGRTGRNTLIISRRYGSWVFLGEILSTVAFPPDEPARRPASPCPSGCRRCIDACPTGALFAPHRIDASRCISYLTIEHEGPISSELAPLMESWVFGCDRCQDVCPLNVAAAQTNVPDFQTHRAGPTVSIRELLELRKHEDTVHRFAGSPLMRAGRRGLVRNALVAAANAGLQELRPQVLALTEDADPTVARQATQALRRLT